MYMLHKRHKRRRDNDRKPCRLSFDGLMESSIAGTRVAALGAIASFLFVCSSAACVHYAANGNFNSKGDYLPGGVGFNLADVNNSRRLNSLRNGVKALVWVGRCSGVDAAFLDIVRPYVGKSNVYGFYLIDDPDPTGKYSPLCKADNLRAESDWIHANIPSAKTFILPMNLSSSKTPSFVGTYNRDNSHVDLFGINPFPCRTDITGCDYDMIDRYVAAAESWGIPRSSIVPVYQTFGGGKWITESGGQYATPTAAELQEILSRWRTLVSIPAFDYAYSWGSQNQDMALESLPELQQVISRHNDAGKCK